MKKEDMSNLMKHVLQVHIGVCLDGDKWINDTSLFIGDFLPKDLWATQRSYNKGFAANWLV